MTRLRAAVIGAGTMGRNHVRVLGELPGVEPVAIVDPAAPDLGIPVAADLAELSGRVDFAVLAAPSGLHEDIGLQLSGLGIPTLIEKPVAPTSASALRLARAYAESGVAAAAGHVERFNPVVLALRTALTEGVIGRVRRLETIRIGPFPNRPMPVGVVADLLVHDIDLACFLLDGNYLSVTAEMRTDPGRSCEDDVRVEALLQRSDGQRIEVTQHAGRTSPERQRMIHVSGDRGNLAADLFTQTLVVREDCRTVAEMPIARDQPLAGELAAWCEVVRSGRPDPILASLTDGARAVQVAEAVLDSASAGTPVTLDCRAA